MYLCRDDKYSLGHLKKKKNEKLNEREILL